MEVLQHSIQQEVHFYLLLQLLLVFLEFLEYLVSQVLMGLVYHLVVKHDKDQTYVQQLLIVFPSTFHSP